MIRSTLLPLILSVAPALAWAEGFAINDLRQLSFDPSRLGDGFSYEATDRDRLTIFCASCDGLVAIDVLLGRQNDGTEGRVRSGQTTISQLEAQCRARNDTCRLEAVSVGPAIGWISTFSGAFETSTTVLLRDGDLLTIRSIAGDLSDARRNGEIVRDRLAPTIIGN